MGSPVYAHKFNLEKDFPVLMRHWIKARDTNSSGFLMMVNYFDLEAMIISVTIKQQ